MRAGISLSQIKQNKRHELLKKKKIFASVIDTKHNLKPLKNINWV